ncbi:MAG: ZIP family metal transporter [Lachnospiraceae bacterium]|nr:ZIP family metal transporter [Lachnospiraceae bacterium]
MSKMSLYIGAILGTVFTFLMTMLGSSVVFFTKESIKESTQKIFLGFAAGVMIAASIWSLLLPAMEAAEEMNLPAWLPAGGGFVLGGVFLWLVDRLVRKFRPKKLSHGSFLLFSAITMHNIPEGMAVGLAFAAIGSADGSAGNLLLLNGSSPNYMVYASAIGLALGIGIQNFPEGAAISLPLRKEGVSKWKSFLYGSLTGVVEPIFGILVTLIAGSVRPLMPWLLSFAAGAMIYVVADELIPQAKDDDGKCLGTFGVMVGFLIMMTLDVALG